MPQGRDQRGVSVGDPGGKDQRAETGGREVGAGETRAGSGSAAAEHGTTKRPPCGPRRAAGSRISQSDPRTSPHEVVALVVPAKQRGK